MPLDVFHLIKGESHNSHTVHPHNFIDNSRAYMVLKREHSPGLLKLIPEPMPEITPGCGYASLNSSISLDHHVT